MKILILGTSNSILKDGWTYGFRAALPDAQIDKHIVGASPGMQFVTNLADDLSGYDHVILDCIVNDEHLSRRIGDINYNNRLIFELMSTLASRVNLITLGFTKVNFIKKASPQYLKRRVIAAACGSQFVSFRDLTLRYGRKILGDKPGLYEHLGHPRREIAYAAGHQLGLALADYAAPKAAPAVDYSDNFSVFKPEQLIPGRALSVRANRLLSFEHIELRAGDAIEFPTAGRCIGFYVNARDCRAMLKLAGPSGVRFKETWFNVSDGLELKFVPVTGGFPLDRIEVAGAELPFERSIHTRFDEWPGKKGARVTLGTVAFWNGDIDIPIPAPANDFDAFDLHRLVDRRMAEQHG
ncbi:hypothetical protein [Methylopila turkensis]|uniref:Uncharacterized protein n=1 Tax=Methylopila turkensis TaxID=1437816 RepID=A0A9W6JLZ9_9HYPH|nr:hypothetical protein [Methylopila turkensis]GLK80070.1 hypothetical protein GCM10008174_18110 [Methylopila turkensis]